MKVLPLVAACALAFLAASSRCAAETKMIQRISLDMPTAAERRSGARPWRGGAMSAGQQGRSHGGLTIINGSAAKAGQFPWMLSMIIDDSYFCGGSIISTNWVLTAGHCIDGGKRFTITAGSLKPMEGTEPTMQVVEATGDDTYQHPNYDANFVDNDIGLILTPTAFILGNYVSAVRLPSYSMAVDMMVGQQATISGWGLTSDDYNATIASTLMYVEMTIDNGDACYDLYENVWYPTKLCFATADDHKSTCQGDSGGPLVIQEADGEWTEIGLTSFGSSGGCAQGYPVVFTRVASFLDFIESTTGLEARQ